MASRARLTVRIGAVLTATATAVGVAITASPSAAADGVAMGYRANDYADGRAMAILPPGANGLVNAADALSFGLFQTRPKNSQDQLAQYTNLLYGYPTLTDATLSKYFNDESFGVAPGQVTSTERPGPGVTILRDQKGIPHVYGDTDRAAAFGAGYAQAKDRLFLMDVLRNYGHGTLASFLGGSCEFEQMDHDQLLLAPYTEEQAVAQVDALPARYGAEGELARTMIYGYVDGVNAYIRAALANPLLLPADYAAAVPEILPAKWTVADVVAVAGLIGGIFGKGGGNEVGNAALLQYLRNKLGAAEGQAAFAQFKNANNPLAPTTVVDKAFPYDVPGVVDPATTALPDDATKPLIGGPIATDPNCNLFEPNLMALSIVKALQDLPKSMSNALVVNRQRSADGHPIAVFGPQVSYFAPQILSQLDIHSPNYDASGASFPGTGLVELGRGRDYAWSATSAGTDIIDQRLELICNPDGGAPQATGTHYLVNGECKPMVKQTHTQLALPKPGGLGAPALIKRDIYLTDHGVVQGWTTADGGKPVAVVNQRSTYNHEVDSAVGFIGFGNPNRTHDVTSWMTSAAKIDYTFNWFYVDDRDTGYFVSGLQPIRPSDVDPSLPTWGTGESEWQGFVPAAQHVQQINPEQGFFISWNNKPAPSFAAADDQYGYGQVYRSQLLVDQLRAQFKAHGGKVTRADVVQAMEAAASQDLRGASVVKHLLGYLAGRPQPAGVSRMLMQLNSWVASGAHRRKAAPSATHYASAAAVAIADELIPNLIRALFDPILADGGVNVGGGGTPVKYTRLPMAFTDTPNSGHKGSAFNGGYESYLVTALQQIMGQTPVDAFGPAITSRLCGNGDPAQCQLAIGAALLHTYDALVAANGTTDVDAWTASSASKAANQTMPQFDAIEFRTTGLVGQPAVDWQNRPTFQQAVSFPRHRPR